MQFGQPISETIRDVPVPGEPELMNQIHVLTYYGLEMDVMHVNYIEPYDIIIGLRVTNNYHPMKFDIQIGDKKDRIEHLFGKGEEDGQAMTYSIEDPLCCDTVKFYFTDNNTLQMVKWDWQVD